MKTVAMYEPFKIGNITVKNRLVRSALFEYTADNGRITSRIIDLYRELGRGGCGLIISGMQAVSPEGRVGPVMVEATYDRYETDLGHVARAARQGGGVFFVQLNHSGDRTAKLEGYDHLSVSPKDIEGCAYHEASEEEISKIVSDFARAAARCRAAGCDGVQIHAAHGFLINTFLSPYFNHRSDGYGGSIEGRARILFEVYAAVRSAVGDDFSISVKVPFSDRVTPSLTPDECLFVCRELERLGVDMIEISSGVTMDGGAKSFVPVMRRDAEGPFLSWAAQIAGAVSVPVVSVCGYRTPEFIERALTQTPIAAVSLGRPLIREPHLPIRWRTDPTRAACISCNQCCKPKGIIACRNRTAV